MNDCGNIVELIELLNEVSKELEVEGYDGPLETPTKEELESEKGLIELLAEVSKELDDERKLEKEARKKKKVPCPTPKYAAKIMPDERKIKNDENKKEMQIPSEKSKKALLEMTILEKREAAIDKKRIYDDSEPPHLVKFCRNRKAVKRAAMKDRKVCAAMYQPMPESMKELRASNRMEELRPRDRMEKID